MHCPRFVQLTLTDIWHISHHHTAKKHNITHCSSQMMSQRVTYLYEHSFSGWLMYLKSDLHYVHNFSLVSHGLTHWGWVTHICVSKRAIIGSDNGMSPSRCQAISWTNAEILLIGPSGTILSENFIKINTFSFKKMHLKMSSGKWQPSCLGLNVLNNAEISTFNELAGNMAWDEQCS